MATAEFSKFVGILSAALSQHHLQGLLSMGVYSVLIFGRVKIQMWKILKETGIPDHLTCLLRNLYAGQEATVRTGNEQQTGSK